MNTDTLIRGGVAVGALFLARIVGGWRGSRQKQAALTTPLFDAALLEAALEPRPRDGDDPALLAELKETLTHLNRQAWAAEFWDLHTQIAALDATLDPAPRATLHRAVLRLLLMEDRWLQTVAAQTASNLNLTDAVRPLQARLALGGEDPRFRAVLEDALAHLQGDPANTNGGE